MSHLNFSQAKWLKKCSKKVVGYNNPIRKMVRPHCKVKHTYLFLILILKSINHITFTHVNIYANV